VNVDFKNPRRIRVRIALLIILSTYVLASLLFYYSTTQANYLNKVVRPDKDIIQSTSMVMK
jgi:hypothetical protein